MFLFGFQEGFLCPMCKMSLASPEDLQAHYDNCSMQNGGSVCVCLSVCLYLCLCVRGGGKGV